VNAAAEATTSGTLTTQATNASLLGLNPEAIYKQASPSVVTVEGVLTNSTGSTTILGSGFVTELQGVDHVITNYHVVQDLVGPTVTFLDENVYPANVVGTDLYVNLAVLSVQALQVEFQPLQIGNSSQLVVGEPVVAIGNRFRLSGSMTFGIVS
jgi:putative serine protease PepD